MTKIEEEIELSTNGRYICDENFDNITILTNENAAYIAPEQNSQNNQLNEIFFETPNNMDIFSNDKYKHFNSAIMFLLMFCLNVVVSIVVCVNTEFISLYSMCIVDLIESVILMIAYSILFTLYYKSTSFRKKISEKKNVTIFFILMTLTSIILYMKKLYFVICGYYNSDSNMLCLVKLYLFLETLSISVVILLISGPISQIKKNFNQDNGNYIFNGLKIVLCTSLPLGIVIFFSYILYITLNQIVSVIVIVLYVITIVYRFHNNIMLARNHITKKKYVLAFVLGYHVISYMFGVVDLMYNINELKDQSTRSLLTYENDFNVTDSKILGFNNVTMPKIPNIPTGFPLKEDDEYMAYNPDTFIKCSKKDKAEGCKNLEDIVIKNKKFFLKEDGKKNNTLLESGYLDDKEGLFITKRGKRVKYCETEKGKKSKKCKNILSTKTNSTMENIPISEPSVFTSTFGSVKDEITEIPFIDNLNTTESFKEENKINDTEKVNKSEYEDPIKNITDVKELTVTTEKTFGDKKVGGSAIEKEEKEFYTTESIFEGVIEDVTFRNIKDIIDPENIATNFTASNDKDESATEGMTVTTDFTHSEEYATEGMIVTEPKGVIGTTIVSGFEAVTEPGEGRIGTTTDSEFMGITETMIVSKPEGVTEVVTVSEPEKEIKVTEPIAVTESERGVINTTFISEHEGVTEPILITVTERGFNGTTGVGDFDEGVISATFTSEPEGITKSKEDFIRTTVVDESEYAIESVIVTEPTLFSESEGVTEAITVTKSAIITEAINVTELEGGIDTTTVTKLEEGVTDNTTVAEPEEGVTEAIADTEPEGVTEVIVDEKPTEGVTEATTFIVPEEGVTESAIAIEAIGVDESEVVTEGVTVVGTEEGVTETTLVDEPEEDITESITVTEAVAATELITSTKPEVGVTKAITVDESEGVTEAIAVTEPEEGVIKTTVVDELEGVTEGVTVVDTEEGVTETITVTEPEEVVTESITITEEGVTKAITVTEPEVGVTGAITVSEPEVGVIKTIAVDESEGVITTTVVDELEGVTEGVTPKIKLEESTETATIKKSEESITEDKKVDNDKLKGFKVTTEITTEKFEMRNATETEEGKSSDVIKIGESKETTLSDTKAPEDIIVVTEPGLPISILNTTEGVDSEKIKISETLRSLTETTTESEGVDLSKEPEATTTHFFYMPLNITKGSLSDEHKISEKSKDIFEDVVANTTLSADDSTVSPIGVTNATEHSKSSLLFELMKNDTLYKPPELTSEEVEKHSDAP